MASSAVVACGSSASQRSCWPALLPLCGVGHLELACPQSILPVALEFAHGVYSTGILHRFHSETPEDQVPKLRYPRSGTHAQVRTFRTRGGVCAGCFCRGHAKLLGAASHVILGRSGSCWHGQRLGGAASVAAGPAQPLLECGNKLLVLRSRIVPCMTHSMGLWRPAKNGANMTAALTRAPKLINGIACRPRPRPSSRIVLPTK